MPSWNNWSGKLNARPQGVHFLRSEEDTQQIVARANDRGQNVRTAGATHSHSPLLVTDGLLLDTAGLAGVISADTSSAQARLWAGSRLKTIGLALNRLGLALHNQGDIDEQAIAGATGTGTHGTGVSLKNLSSAVVGARLILASGDAVECSTTENPELWQAARLHLGALGVVTQLNLQLRPAYRLSEAMQQTNLEDALARFDELAQTHRHCEFFWYPQSDEANLKTISETEEPAHYPLAEEGARRAWSHEVLPNHRPHKHTEMEYSVPASEGPACMSAIARLLQTKFTDVRWPVEYRTLAADDVWLSTAYERDTVTISVHQDIREDDEPYFRACEEIFLAFGGRPHWGKVHYLDGQRLSSAHPMWQSWWRVRNDVDPKGTFLNEHLRAISPQLG